MYVLKNKDNGVNIDYLNLLFHTLYGLHFTPSFYFKMHFESFLYLPILLKSAQKVMILHCLVNKIGKILLIFRISKYL